MEREADVIIIGAGLSGLMAAYEVQKAGYEPLVIEANDRVGGRILTDEPIPGVPIENGAQWIGDTHHRMFALAKDLGVGTYAQFEDGDTTYEIPGGPILREGDFHAKHEAELAGMQAVLTKIDEMSAEISPEAPWLAPHAAEWDEITAGAWADVQGMGPVARTLFEICSVGIMGVPLAEISLLHLLWTVAECGVTSELLAESEGGAQTTRFIGGSSEIPNRLADRVGRDRIELNAPVLTLDYSDDRVRVTCRNGLIATGRQAIVALAPALAGRIMYNPPLPGIRDQLTQRVPNASAVKVYAFYDEPFWRADGLNGQLISAVGPARMTNDSCLADGGPGIILAFLEGDQARTFGRLPEAELHGLVAEELGRHFGPRAAKPELVVSCEWANREWTRGCYQGNMGPLVWTKFGTALGEPVGPIKWGSSEVGYSWSGYMEGAVQAGQTAAEQVLADLK